MSVNLRKTLTLGDYCDLDMEMKANRHGLSPYPHGVTTRLESLLNQLHST